MLKFIFISFTFLYSYSYCGIHKSPIFKIDCGDVLKSISWETETDSYLLVEGESLFLDCGVCRSCADMAEECGRKLSVQDWTIQRSRYLGYGGPVEGKLEEHPFDLPRIRMRLHERLWPGSKQFPGILEPLLRSDHSISPQTVESPGNKSSDDKPPPLASNVNLYILMAKLNEAAKVFRPPKRENKNSRIMLTADTVHIRHTRLTDTGVYYCFWRGKRLKEWAVTVVGPHEEPYRHITGPTYIHRMVQMMESDRQKYQKAFVRLREMRKLLKPENLVDHNLGLYTAWSAWSNCVPCLAAEQVTLQVNGTMGSQMRVGICRVRVLDGFHPIRPHSLALVVDDILKSHGKRGLPCRSHLIRDAMMQYGPIELRNRPGEIEHRKCAVPCNEDFANRRKQTYRFPARVKLRINEGEKLMISCPIRGPVKGPITWYYSYSNPEELINLTRMALSEETITRSGSPSAYLLGKLDSVESTTLYQSTRGRFRIDPAHNLVVAEMIDQPPGQEIRLHHLICVHGEPRARRENGFSDWAGIIDIEVLPRFYAVMVLAKISQIVLLIIPFILACGTFLIVIVTIQTERKPRMRAAAEGFTNKSPP